jgi:hypothetical protein
MAQVFWNIAGERSGKSSGLKSGRASMAVVHAAANHRGAPNCSLTRLDIGKWMGCRQRSGPKPPTSCSGTPPCAPYWYTQDVSCPTCCGLPASNTTVNVVCKATVSGQIVIVADSWCSGPKPPVVCPATPPCAEYHWHTSEECCPIQCGCASSVIPLNLQCIVTSSQNPAGQVVADSYCASLPKPNATLICPATAPCAPYWSTNATNCPTQCGLLASLSSAGATCQGTINNQVVVIANSWCTGNPPSVLCPATPPCSPFWSNESVTCPIDCGLSASNVTTGLVCKGTVNGQVVEVADSFCADIYKPPVLCPATPPCAYYLWQLGNESCPMDCGLLASVVSRSVVCMEFTTLNLVGQQVNDSFCANSTMPNGTLLNCPYTPPCAPYWFTDVPCPCDCGLLESNTTDGVVCKGLINDTELIIADSWCLGEKPSVDCPATMPCGSHWCPSGAVCPTNCGCVASTTTEGVLCKGTVNNQVVVVADSWCTAPRLVAQCPATPPCAPFWDTNSVQCPSQCGLPASNTTQGILCKGTVNGQVVAIPNSYCTTAPVAVPCNSTPSCVTYYWKVGPEQCPQTCGCSANSVTQSILCIANSSDSSQGAIVADTFCDMYSRPSGVLQCSSTPPCAPYWYSAPISCPSSCGYAAVNVTRTVLCKGLVNSVLTTIANSYCTGAQPSSIVTCPATSECVTYNWASGSACCPSACGYPATTITRNLTCLAYSTSHPQGVVVDNSFCHPVTKPDKILYCPALPCAPTWWVSDVQCPTRCAQPPTTVQRSVKCKGMINNQLVTVADSWCTESKPNNTATCPATAECVNYNWSVSSQTCPTACGAQASIVSRTVQCLASTSSNSQGTIVADTFCKLKTKPKTLLYCSATPPCSPAWWSSTAMCPTACGQAQQNVTRVIKCRGTINGQAVVVANSWCTGTPPSSVVLCPATEPCAPSGYYAWRTSNESCPSACGQYATVIERTVVCVTTSSGAVVADSFCSSSNKPPVTINCTATAACGANQSAPLQALRPIQDTQTEPTHTQLTSSTIILGVGFATILALGGMALWTHRTQYNNKPRENYEEGFDA